MIVKIYLVISIFAFILTLLTNLSLLHHVKIKYIRKCTVKIDNAGIICSFIKIFIISFIPIFHISIIFTILFCGNMIDEQSEKIIKEVLENEEKQETD